jgi:hypothetical protein
MRCATATKLGFWYEVARNKRSRSRYQMEVTPFLTAKSSGMAQSVCPNDFFRENSCP